MQRQARSIQKESITMEDFQSRAFFNVLETDAAYLDQYGNWQKSPDKKSLVRADNGSYISTVGKNYSIVDNRKYFEGVINALTEAEVQYEPKMVYEEGNGRRTTMVVKLPQFQLYKGHPTEQQDFELRIRNSFDTTMAADTILGFLRLICTNGMTAFDAQFSYRMIHKGDIVHKAEQAIELYKDFEGVWQRNKQIIERLASAHGQKDMMRKYIGDGEVSLNSMFKGERWASKLQQKWHEANETTNLWDLYNIMTNIISHEYGHSYSSKINKMSELNKETKKWSHMLGVSDAIMY